MSNPDYASVFVSFKKTAGILEIMVAQATPTTKNYQRAAQGKLLADRAEAEREEMYYSAITQVIEESIEAL